MKNASYNPLKSIQRMERDYPGIYAQLETTDFTEKKEYGAIRDKAMEKQRILYYSKVIKREMDIVEAEQRAINDNVFLLISRDWIKSKQVYSFSQEFIDILSGMDDFEINAELLNYLPFPTFYIEFPENDFIHGILVKYSSIEKMIYYCICYQSFQFFDGLNAGVLDLKLFSRFSDFVTNDGGVARNKKEEEEITLNMKILAIVFQICMYLCADNKDIQENEEQKKIYRPSKSVKNRYSEIRKWDVGYRVMQEHKKIEQNAKKEWITRHPNDRKRPRMHWRKAHWHTFCCGMCRKERRVKFIAPILVNKLQDDEVPVVNRVK